MEEFGPFDVVVDDGSHQAADVLASFNLLFAAGMKDEGIYIVEDLHTSYHPGFVGKHLPFLDIVKQLIDAMHAHYHRMHGLSGGASSPELGDELPGPKDHDHARPDPDLRFDGRALSESRPADAGTGASAGRAGERR